MLLGTRGGQQLIEIPNNSPGFRINYTPQQIEEATFFLTASMQQHHLLAFNILHLN